MRTLLANATVITMNPARDVLDTDILIENGVIADMGPGLAGRPENADAERADLGGIVDVRAAAELDGLAAHVDHADHVAVFFAEQGDGAELLGLVDRHFLRLDAHAAQHELADQTADLDQLVGRDGGEVGEVIAQTIRLDERTGIRFAKRRRPLQAGRRQR